MINENANKGISRIDSGSTHGWFVRAYKNGKTYSKLFSDRKHGDRDSALASALTYREELYLKLAEIPEKPRKRRVVYHDSRNTTGVLGVCRTAKKSSNGKVSECYSVSWRPDSGVQKCTSFSINKYGEKRAFEMAVEHRRKMLSKIHSKAVLKKMKTTNPSIRLKNSPEAQINVSGDFQSDHFTN